MRRLLLVFAIVLTAACGSNSQTEPSGGTGGTAAGSGGAPATSGAGGSGGSEAGSGGGGAAAGSGGAGGAFTWPTCEAQPAEVDAVSIPALWQADPAMPTPSWLSGVIVTAISKGGCTADKACQLFLQDAETYASFAEGAQHAIKLFASAATAEHFVGIQIGDVVDVLGHGWRYSLGGQNELLVQVNLELPGCARKTGAATPSPIEGVTLAELTLVAYEQTHGPLFVKVDTVSGKPHLPTETFALWPTGTTTTGEIVSLSPFFLTGGAFAGLTPEVITDFTSVSGVFGLFVPDPAGPKYLELYPRAMAEVVLAP